MKYFLIFIFIVVLGWYPWLTAEEAIQLVDARVAKMQRENPNLCAMSVDKKSIRKVPFGYTEKVSYDCTVTDDFYGVSKSTNIVYITFYKGLLGMPGKTVQKSL